MGRVLRKTSGRACLNGFSQTVSPLQVLATLRFAVGFALLSLTLSSLYDDPNTRMFIAVNLFSFIIALTADGLTKSLLYVSSMV